MTVEIGGALYEGWWEEPRVFEEQQQHFRTVWADRFARGPFPKVYKQLLEYMKLGVVPPALYGCADVLNSLGYIAKFKPFTDPNYITGSGAHEFMTLDSIEQIAYDWDEFIEREVWPDE